MFTSKTPKATELPVNFVFCCCAVLPLLRAQRSIFKKVKVSRHQYSYLYLVCVQVSCYEIMNAILVWHQSRQILSSLDNTDYYIMT